MYRYSRRLLMYVPETRKTHRGPEPVYATYRQHLRIQVGFMVVGLLLLLYTVAQKVQKRLRSRDNAARSPAAAHNANALRVVIIGGGTGGAALAAALTHACPEHQIIVIEESKVHTFWGMLPLAFVGHRSYDMGTAGGAHYLNAPSSWNVTRDAALVAGSVVHVRPEEQEVIVKPAQNVTAEAEHDKLRHTAQGLLRSEEHGTHVFPAVRGPAQSQRHEKDKGRRSARWRALCGRGGWQPNVAAHISPSMRTTHSEAQPGESSTDAEKLKSVGGRVLADGLVAYSYDVLIVASGARRTLGALAHCLQPAQLDRYGITISPGSTRDMLANIYQGNILYLKVPPRSFVRAVERARQSAAWPPARRVVLGEESRERGGDAALAAIAHPLRAPAASRGSDAHDGASGGTSEHLCSRWGADDAIGQAARRLMCYSTRQFDGTFLSTVNTIWKYLQYSNKFGLCRFYAVTADAAPMGDGPPELNAAMLRFWQARQALSCAQGSRDARFQLLSHTYPLALDQRARRVTLYNYAHNVELTVPYMLLVLDLPLRAPYFVRGSGLHRVHYVAHDEAQGAHTDSAEGGAVGALQRQQPVAQDYEDEAGFIDVDPQTLQHRTYSNIFALGDVAGLPTSKSYGATLAQMPVVLHNVIQTLHNLECKAQRAKAGSTYSAQDDAALVPHAVNARYDGYSSFHVMMTTWRAMWPEMHYNATQEEAFAAATQNSSAGVHATDQMTSAPLTPCCHHMWDNLSWRGLRGVCNGTFCQLTLYELAYFYLFNRAMWYPPGWFTFPVFPEVALDAAAS